MNTVTCQRKASPNLLVLLSDRHQHRMLGCAGDPATAEIRRELTDLIFADGWNPDQVATVIRKRQPDHQYLSRWSQAVGVRDPSQWGLPAQL